MNAELAAALLAIEGRWAGHHWHCYASSNGSLWATSPHCEIRRGSGTTVSAGDVNGRHRYDPCALEHAIEREERGWAMGVRWAA